MKHWNALCQWQMLLILVFLWLAVDCHLICRYFSLQATCPLGFSDKIRFCVEQNICREEGPLPDCFRKPADIVLNVLEKVLFHASATSALFWYIYLLFRAYDDFAFVTEVSLFQNVLYGFGNKWLLHTILFCHRTTVSN